MKMFNFVAPRKIMKHFLNCSMTKLQCLFNSFLHLLHSLALHTHPFWLELSYFIFLSLIGSVGMKFSNTKTASFRPKSLDVLFTSVSASTVSSMSTVEMEVFSNSQLIILTILMFTGGEVFTSFLSLHFTKFKLTEKKITENKVGSFIPHSNCSNPTNFLDQIELGMESIPQKEYEKPNPTQEIGIKIFQNSDFFYSCIELLAYVVLCYLLVSHLFGSVLIYIYIRFIPSAKEILERKGLNRLTFSVFTTVSTFSNCGFIPTNENMMVFKKNSGLLLILIPQILMGNTLYHACLRFEIWVLQKFTRREEFSYMLQNSIGLGYNHLFPGLYSTFLIITAFGFLSIQFMLFYALEWHSEVTEGLSTYEKLVGSLFQIVNSRHAGESVFDLSMLAPALLVLFTLMMYLPPYTHFLPIKGIDESESKTAEKATAQGKNILDRLLLTQLTYLVIFIFLICITEERK